MPDIEPTEKPSVVSLRPASNPSLDLGPQPPGDDWLCLSWLDRSEYTTAIKRTSSERPTLAGYEVRRELGQGSLGTVYLARDPRLKRRVAIKLMRENLVEAGDLERFRADAAAVGKLQHPNIAAIYGTGEIRGRPFLVLEYVAGPNLREFLDGKPLVPRFAAEMFESIARAVQQAHERGILHRDLKPRNIVIGPEDGIVAPSDDSEFPIPHSEFKIPKVTDFGVARLREQTGSIGSPCYAAPELAESATEPSTAADVYSLGAIFYEILTGRPPFNGPDVAETLAQARSYDPAPPRQLQPGVPRDLETICLKCLRKSSNERYASAGELADEIRRFLEGRPIHARPLNPVARSIHWARRHPAKATLAGIALLAVAALVASVALLVAAHRREQAGQQKIEQSRDRALAAADELLDEIGTSSRLRQADLSDLRRALLTRALPRYQEFVKATDGDPTQDPLRARALARLGFLHRELGDVTKAIDDFAAARDLYESLAARVPEDADFQRGLAFTLLARGKTLVQAGRPREARQEFSRCREILEALTKGPAAAAEDQAGLADCNFQLGLLEAGSRLDGRDQLREAVAGLQSLAQRRPDLVHARATLVEARIKWGRQLVGAEMNGEAREQFQSALSDSWRLAQDLPADADLRLLHARALLALGEFQWERNEQAPGAKSLVNARRILDNLAPQLGENPEYRSADARCLYDVAETLISTPREDEAFAMVRTAIERQEQSVAADASNDRRIELASSCGLLGRLHARKTQDREALTWLNRCIEPCEQVLSRDGDHAAAQECMRRNLPARGDTLLRLEQFRAAAHDFDEALSSRRGGAEVNLLNRQRTIAWALAGDMNAALPKTGAETAAAARELIHRFNSMPSQWITSEKRRGQFRSAAIALLKLASEKGRLADAELRALADDEEFKALRFLPEFVSLLKSSVGQP